MPDGIFSQEVAVMRALLVERMTSELDALRERFQELLRELFQFDHEDLDFGIYRIMNYKRRVIDSFVSCQLMDLITRRLNLLREREMGEEKEENGSLRGIFETNGREKRTFSHDAFQGGRSIERGHRGIMLDQAREFRQRQRSSSSGVDLIDLEKAIYNHLINFFSRYYDQGDFVTQRRHGRHERYVIPHDGEEVFLYWTNRDQYYIKTTDLFRKYQFRCGDLTVTFRTVAVEEGKDNVKTSSRVYFFLADAQFSSENETIDENAPKHGSSIVKLEDGHIELRFSRRGLREEEKKIFGVRPRQEEINEHLITVVKKRRQELQLPVAEDELERCLRKHLLRFARKNTHDFFIHKDLKGFLTRELDFYIKNEILDLNNLRKTVSVLIPLAEIVKDVATAIIDFLAQVEDFQKCLWEKKKFVLQTNYIITLDRIREFTDDHFMDRFVVPKILSNREQLKEWEELLGLSVKTPEDLIERTAFQEKAWKQLPLDTKYFDEDFKWFLLEEMTKNGTSLDHALDGILIHGENWQALNLLQEKYREKIRTTYIDPPYNTGGDDFLYKDRYRHSSWLSMMSDRLELLKDLMAESSVLFISIDDNELYRLKLLLDSIFGEQNYVETFLWTRTATPPSLSKKSRTTTEYVLCYERKFDSNLAYVGERTTKEGDQPLLNRGNPIRELVFPPNTIKVYLPDGEYSPKKYERTELLNSIVVKDGMIVTECRLKGEFKWSQDFLNKEIEKGTRFIIKSSKFAIRFLRPPESGGYIAPNKRIKERYVLEIDKKNAGVDTNDKATLELRDLGLHYTNPKPTSLIKYLCNFITKDGDYILDFFAGSGTTAEAVLRLNVEQGTERKFILVEMADYVHYLILPRLKKLSCYLHWKKGVPQRDKINNGTGLFMKYQSIESYDDALENVVLVRKPSLFPETEGQALRYLLYHETADSPTFLKVDELIDPFNYKLRVSSPTDVGIRAQVTVDLIETFNYLIGLWVDHVWMTEVNKRKYRVVIGHVGYHRVVVVWRPLHEFTEEVIEADKAFIEKEIVARYQPDILYVNGDCAVKGAKSIEVVFRSKLFNQDMA